LSVETADQPVKLRTLSFLWILYCRAQIHKSRHLLFGLDAEAAEDAAVISIPFRKPGSAEAMGVGGEQQILADRARRQDLLPFRGLMRPVDRRDDADNDGGPQETPFFRRDAIVFRGGFAGLEGCGQNIAGSFP